jgi:hypothetical protein
MIQVFAVKPTEEIKELPTAVMRRAYLHQEA